MENIWYIKMYGKYMVIVYNLITSIQRNTPTQCVYNINWDNIRHIEILRIWEINMDSRFSIWATAPLPS